MKITLYEYNMLTDEEQFSLVFNVGVFWDSKINGNQRYALYAVNMFFVEVEYDNVENIIIDQKAFVTGEILNKYSNLI